MCFACAALLVPRFAARDDMSLGAVAAGVGSGTLETRSLVRTFLLIPKRYQRVHLRCASRGQITRQ